MRAWSWFVVTPLALAAAYFSASPLERRVTGQEAAVTPVAPLSLPNLADKPAPKAANLAEREIHFAAFGIVTPSDAKTITRTRRPSEIFALQSVLMAGNSGTAVIDGDLVHPGDIIGGGYRIARIESHAVWLSDPRIKPAKGHKEVFEVLRFPEYRDEVALAQPVRGAAAPAPGSSGQSTDRGGLEKEYLKVLEMLKL